MEEQRLRQYKYGIYDIKDDLRLSVGDNLINITKVADNQYKYIRKSGNDELKQRINVNSSFTLHVAPTPPLNLPEYKTDLVYLDFREPLYLESKVTTKVTIAVPIEIGIFIKNDSDYKVLDCFSCDPNLSRFALYGTPTEGHFCKHAHVDFDKQDYSCYGLLDLTIKNNMNSSAKIGKIVYNASTQDIFYNDDKVRLGSVLMELDENNSSNAIVSIDNTPEKDDTVSPRIKSESSESFVMTEGYE